MGGMGEADAAELLAETVMTSIGWLHRAVHRKPDQSDNAPLSSSEIDLLRPVVAAQIRDDVDLDPTLVDGVEAYLVSGDFRLLLDHLVACLLLDQHVGPDGVLARMSAAGLRQFLPDDTVTAAF